MFCRSFLRSFTVINIRDLWSFWKATIHPHKRTNLLLINSKTVVCIALSFALIPYLSIFNCNGESFCSLWNFVSHILFYDTPAHFIEKKKFQTPHFLTTSYVSIFNFAEKQNPKRLPYRGLNCTEICIMITASWHLIVCQSFS